MIPKTFLYSTINLACAFCNLWPFSWLDQFLCLLMTGFAWCRPMFPCQIPDGRGALLCESGPIYVVSFYLFSRHNSLINWRVSLKCLHTNIFIKTPSLEGLPTKAKEDPSPHEIKLSPAGHQPRISYSRGYYYFYYCYYYYYHHHHHHYYYYY